MNHPTLGQKFDARIASPDRPSTLGWQDFFQWLGQQTAAPKPRGARSKLIQE
jgi:hypothetical protein